MIPGWPGLAVGLALFVGNMPSPMSLEEAWEATTTVCLLYVAIVVPFQVAFIEQAAFSTFFWIGLCIDLVRWKS